MRRSELMLIGALGAVTGIISTVANTVPQAAVGSVVMIATAVSVVLVAERRGWVKQV